jgi:hypothetical protein
MKGTITNVNIGPLVIEGVLGDDGNLYVASRTLCSLFSAPQKNISRELKAILGEDSSAPQIVLTQEKEQNLPTRLTCIPLTDFERVLRYYDRKGNAQAQQLTDVLIGLSLTQLFNDAFGLKFEKEERQEWMDKRLKGKATRRTHTDALMEWGIRTTGQKPEGKLYSDITNGIYQYCFRKTAAELKAEKGIKKGQLLRDFFSPKELSQVEAVEQVIMMAVDRGANPYTALAKLSL